MENKTNCKTLKLTQSENKVLESLINGLYAERGFSDFGLGDIKDETGLAMRSLRGVLGSLVKKGVVNICDRKGEWLEDDNGRLIPENSPRRTAYHIIYLCDEYHSLHPEWKEEAKEEDPNYQEVKIEII